MKDRSYFITFLKLNFTSCNSAGLINPDSGVEMRIIGITGICIFQKIKTVFYSFGKAFMQVLIT